MYFGIIIIVFFLLLIIYSFVIIHAIEGWQSRGLFMPDAQKQTTSYSDITIVIPVRDADKIIVPDLPVPIIIVDDHSNQPLNVQGGANVEIITNTNHQGKKWALRCGIEHAQTKYVVTTDCDTRLTAQWLQTVCAYLADHQPDMLIMPLKMRRPDNLLSALQETEYVAIQTLTGGYAMSGNPIMCSGANMLVNREHWLASWDDIMSDIASGDDMFMLHSFKRQGLNIDFLKSPSALLEIEPAMSLKDLFRQRARWAGKAGHYTDRTTKQVGAMVVIANMAVLLFPPFVLIKWIIDLTLLWTSQRFFGFQHAMLKSLALSVVYPVYVLITLILIPFRKNQW